MRKEPNAIRAQRSFDGRDSHLGGLQGAGINVYFVSALVRKGGLNASWFEDVRFRCGDILTTNYVGL